MLSWTRAKSDLAHVVQYENDIVQLWKAENEAAEILKKSRRMIFGFDEWQKAIQRQASENPRYQEIRAKVARGTDRIKRIAWENGVAIDVKSLPAPGVGGAVIPVNLFDAVLHDNSHGGIQRQWVIDPINKTKGAAEEHIESEFRKLVNPLQWLKDGVILILRLPSIVIQTTGFDLTKVEDHLIGKTFKVIALALLLWIAFKLGFGGNQLRELFQSLIIK